MTKFLPFCYYLDLEQVLYHFGMLLLNPEHVAKMTSQEDGCIMPKKGVKGWRTYLVKIEIFAFLGRLGVRYTSWLLVY